MYSRPRDLIPITFNRYIKRAENYCKLDCTEKFIGRLLWKQSVKRNFKGILSPKHMFILKSSFAYSIYENNAK